MKKAVCFAIILFALLVCAVAMADPIDISSKYFEDPNFQEFLLQLPEGSDGVLTDEEIDGITKLEVNKENIRSLKGIKLFTELSVLDCSDNSIEKLDVSGMTKLKNLRCDNNKTITSLNTSGCSALQVLSAYNNSISSSNLNISGCSALQDLELSINQLTTLDVSGLSSLKNLNAYTNNLSSLNLSGCSSLEELAVYGNSLSSLNLSSCPKLTILSVSENKLTSINISKCAASLLYLGLENNQLSSVSVDGCSSLIALWCHGNKISSLDITTAPKIKSVFRNGKQSDEGTYLSYVSSDVSDYAFENALTVDKSTVVLANKVSFNANGGSGTMKSQAAPNDKAFTLTANAFTRNGWKFTSWNTSKDGSGTAYADKASVTLKNKDLELYAQWEKDPEQPEQPQQPEQPEQQSEEQLTLKKLKSVKLKAVSKKKIKVSWKKLSKKTRRKVKQIEIQISTDPEFRTILKTKLVKSTKKSYTFGGLKKNTRYYIRVRAYTEKDGVKNVSPWVKKSKKTKKK